VRHLFRLDVLVELFAGEEAERDGRLAQGDATLVRVLGYLRRAVVTDVRR
jgi:hypothetical protein